ncbi:MAG TPA: PAS-domain containing protein [Rhizomicrobium sp.]|nr:PAS-domain containing protein [Rhizomicrobium sp.]
MHNVVDFFLWLSTLASQLAPKLAAIAGRAPHAGDVTLAAVVVSSIVVASACTVWVFVERARFKGFREWVRMSFARAQNETLIRDGIIAAGEESIVVMGTHLNEPLSFGGGSAMLQVCLAGPDAGQLAPALDNLLSKAQSFSLKIETAGAQKISVRGKMIGGQAVVFFRRLAAAMDSTIDYRAALDALPVPVWVRDRNLSLAWANNAFLASVGKASIEDAAKSNAQLVESEREFAESARAGRQVIDVRRMVEFAGEQHPFAFTARALPNGGVAGMAVDMTNAIEPGSARSHQRDMFGEFINRLTLPIAVFNAEQRLIGYNSAYVKLWGMSENWLDSQPYEEEIIDRLRQVGRLPERRDFQAWKRAHLTLFENARNQSEEIWHLPGGKSLSVQAQPHPNGGIIFLFEDVTEKLRLERTCNALTKVQNAVLNTMQDSVAIFGPDGRLKTYNDNFLKLTGAGRNELAAEPHVTELAKLGDTRLGSGGMWDIVLAGINSSAPEKYSDWTAVKHAEASAIALSLTRLPDGTTMATFYDLTDEIAFNEDKKKFSPPAAA